MKKQSQSWTRRFDAVVTRAAHLAMAAFYLYKLFIIIGGFAWLAAFAGVLLDFFSLSSSIAIALAFAGSVSVGLNWLILRRMDIQCLNPHLVILQEEAIYEHHGGNRYTFIKRLQVKAKQNGVDCFRARFRWSGQGQVNPTTPLAGHTIRYSPLHDGNWDTCEVKFDALAKGVEQEVEIHVALEVGDLPPQPFHQRLVDDHYRGGLTIISRFPVGASIVGPVTKEIFLAEKAWAPVRRWKEDYDTTRREITWPISGPRFGARYRISWEVAP